MIPLDQLSGRWIEKGRMEQENWELLQKIYLMGHTRQCAFYGDGYYCTLSKGHIGTHAAHVSSGNLIAIWEDHEDPTLDH